MAEFRQIAVGALADQRLRGEADSVTATYAHLLTGQHLTLEGTGELPAGYLAVDRGRPVEDIQSDLDRLAELGLIVREPDSDWTFVAALMRDRGTPNHQKRAARSIDGIPAGTVRDAALAHARKVAPSVADLVASDAIRTASNGTQRRSGGMEVHATPDQTRQEQSETAHDDADDLANERQLVAGELGDTTYDTTESRAAYADLARRASVDDIRHVARHHAERISGGHDRFWEPLTVAKLAKRWDTLLEQAGSPEPVPVPDSQLVELIYPNGRKPGVAA